ncbi:MULTISPECIES: hypothetical protein [Amycolatopsis]|nr:MULTISPECIES: hypothetical protein [Amycolatopsis]
MNSAAPARRLPVVSETPTAARRLPVVSAVIARRLPVVSPGAVR